MAKDLPYFKFSVSEWNDGDVTLCSLEAQGLFINLCSLYWSQEGQLSYTKAKRRYYQCNTTVWDELVNDGIIKLSGDAIIITFLDEQFAEREKLSVQNKKNVEKRWKNADSDTTVLPSNNDGNVPVYNIEERRGEEKRTEKKRGEDSDAAVAAEFPFVEIKKNKEEIIFPFDSPAFKSMWANWIEYRRQIKKPYKSDMAIQAALKKLSEHPEEVAIKMIEESISNQWQGIFEIKQTGNNGFASKQQERTNGLITSFAKRASQHFGGGQPGSGQ